MRKIGVILFVIALLCGLVLYINGNIPIIISPLIKKTQIGSGDLVYRVYLFGIIPLGEATIYAAKIEDYKGVKVYHLSAETKTLKGMSKFFKATAIIDSYIDTQSRSPFIFKQELIVQDKEQIKEVTYDQKEGTMSISGVKRPILPDTHDPLSLLFRIRNLDFSRVKDFEFNLNTNQKNYILEGHAKEKEVSINKKLYEVVVVHAGIRRRDKNPYHKSKIKFIFFKGGNNIPVSIQVFASGIFLNVKLVDIK